MEYAKQVELFLDGVRKKRAGLYALKGIYSLLALLVGAYIAVNAISYFFSPARSLILACLLLIFIPLAGIVYRYFIRGAFARFSQDQAALLVESKIPSLNNSLINSSQLRRYLEHPSDCKGMSLDFVRELMARTISETKNIRSELIFDYAELARNRNLFFIATGLLIALSVVLPDFLARGYSHFMSVPKTTVIPPPSETNTATKPATPSLPPPVYTIQNMTLTYNYPAYTQIKSQVIPNSDGNIQVLPGTEIQVLAKLDKPMREASLVINEKDDYSMKLLDENRIQGQFLADQEGGYRFKIKSPDGQTVQLPTQYNITLSKDQAPKIILFATNFKPVFRTDEKIELRYESRDDYGIHKIDLVAEANGKTERTTIKTLKTPSKEAKESYTWHLTNFNSGDRVKFYLEVEDNDSISGPNTGQTEVFSFSIYDLHDEQENLIRLQDELMDKMIALLAQNLVGNEILFKKVPDATVLKKFMAASADEVMITINMAQNIYNQAANSPTFPESHITLLKNIASGLIQIRGEQIEVLKNISAAIAQATPLGIDFPPAQDVTTKLIGQLEQNILYLIKTTNTQKLDQIADLKEDLQDLAESIKSDINKSKDGKIDNNRLKAQIEKMKQILKKIMDQFTRQTQPSADEFLNPNSFKSLDMEQMSSSLEKIMKLAEEQKLDEAQKELQKLADSMKALSKQIDKASLEKQELISKELVKKIDQSLQNVLDMEKKQSDLMDRTAKINDSIKAAQSKNHEDALKKFFEEMGQLVGQIQSILRENNEFIAKHPAMLKLNELTALESKLTETIQEQGQKALDTLKSAEAEFKKLNEARNRLGEISSEKNALRVAPIQQFKNNLPKVIENYKNLKEQTELSDLTEFNRQFKNLYPEVLRMHNDLQITPNAKEDLADRIKSDLLAVSKLNSEISKKLGTMVRMLEKDYQSQMSRQNQEDLERMSKQESQMQKDAEDLAQQFTKMNQQNPMISPDLAGKMREAGQHMKSAENALNQHNVSKSLESENHILQSLSDTRNMLKDLKNSGDPSDQKAQQESLKLGTGRARDQKKGGGIRNQSEKVELPSQDQFQAPSEFREDILKAMKNKYPRNYEQFVTEYYKELVK